MIRQNATSTKAHNRAAIFTLLLRNPMSRSSLAKATGLTRAAVSLIADDLIAEGFLQEAQGTSRRSVLLSPSPHRFFLGGVDISRGDCILGICDFLGNPLCRAELDWKSAPSPQEAIRLATQKLLLLARQLPEGGKLLAVGVTLPGPVDAHSGQVLRPVDMDFWFHFPVAAEFEKYMDCPVWVENNAVARAVGENYYGFGQKYSSFLELTVFQGIGCGIVSKNRVFLAENGISTGIGHSTINFQGPRCSCGNIGCLELYALPEHLLKTCSRPSWDDVVSHATTDPLCMDAVTREATYLVSALMVLVNLFSPQAIIFSGELNTSSNLLLNLMRQQFSQRLNGGNIAPPDVEFSRISADPRLLSACALGMEKTFWEKR